VLAICCHFDPDGGLFRAKLEIPTPHSFRAGPSILTKSLGLEFPAKVLALADEVIE
jgi:hypothetical protein